MTAPFRSGLCGCRAGFFTLAGERVPCPRCRPRHYGLVRRTPDRWERLHGGKMPNGWSLRLNGSGARVSEEG